jgi:hypothetical protein
MLPRAALPPEVAPEPDGWLVVPPPQAASTRESITTGKMKLKSRRIVFSLQNK